MDDKKFTILENHPADSRVKVSDVFQTLSSRMGTGGGNVPMVMEEQPLLLESTQEHATVQTNGIATTLMARMGTGGNNVPMVVEKAYTMQAMGEYKDIGVASSLKQRDHKDATDLVIEKEPIAFEPGAASRVGGHVYEGGITGSLRAMPGDNQQAVCQTYIVRRLTPLERERLQGYPDGWTDIGEWVDSKGKKHKDSDSPRYKALGNSIALPFWQWLAERMIKQLKADGVDDPKMGSLFDGIGGFPLCYQRAGCKPVWASEIEEFPIAVTKLRFPEKQIRDCANCVNHTDNGCTVWECKFEAKGENDDT